MTRMSTWVACAVGAAAFVVAHLVTSIFWDRLGGQYDPWFLNSGSAVLLTAAALFVTGAAVGAMAPAAGTAGGRGLAAGIGAGVAATVTLFVIGPGTLFPIAIVFAFVVLGASSVAGALLAGMVRNTSRKTP